MRLALVSGAYPPDLDGIGDYTWWMAGTLATQHDVSVFTRTGAEHQSNPGVALIPFFDLKNPSSFGSLLQHVECWSKAGKETHWLVLQYNPFGYGRRGFCPWVPKTLRLIKQRCPNVKLAVMFHETQVPSWPLRFLIMFSWQHPIFKAVCRQADMAFVSTTRWTPQVHRTAGNLPVNHLPVGANIPLCDVSNKDARQRCGIDKDAFVIGIFGGAHISRRLDWMAAAAKEIAGRHPNRKSVLLHVGPDGASIRLAIDAVEIIDKGPLPASEVGTALRAMNLALSPFLDGVSTRRGSVIALMQHGIPIATTRGAWTDDLFLSDAPDLLLLSSAQSAEAFAMETADWSARLPISGPPYPEVTKFHNRHFTWQHIASSMLDCLSN